MKKISCLAKKAFTSITIMVVPHDNHRSLNLRIPAIGIVTILLLAAVGSGCLFYYSIDGMEYRAQHYEMADKVAFYEKQFNQWNSTAMALKTVEGEFRELFSYETKDEVLENVDISYSGSFEIPELVETLQARIDTIEEIKDYLKNQKDIYVATPKGYPVPGEITSGYGKREDPFSGETAFHSGVDISGKSGTPVEATADGVVSYSGWTSSSGYVVVIEHGCGFRTLYAHNKSNKVKVGESVKRGDIISYLGSTGKSTGPHVHYEVWKNGRSVDAQKYLARRS